MAESTLDFPFELEPGIFLHKHFPGILDFQLEPQTERPIFRGASDLCGKVPLPAGWTRKLCGIPT